MYIKKDLEIISQFIVKKFHIMSLVHETSILVPEIKNQLYYCDACDYTTSRYNNYSRHTLTAKHVKTSLEPKNKNNFCCKICTFNTSRQSQYSRHILTAKHVKMSLVHETSCYDKEPILENTMTLTPMNTVENSNNTIILELIKQNNEFKAMLLELAKEPKVITNTNNYNGEVNNKTNNQFNLNTFLNEDCKDAMNISQFIDSIKLTVKDLEETGRLGFIDGLSRIFINALKGLELTDRPIHCTDMKRETVYIKDEDKWAKENTDKAKFVNVLRKIEKKNIGMLPTWINDNPTCRIMDSPEAILYYKIYKSALGDPSKEGIEKQDDKIIKNVLKEVVLEKQPK